MLEIKKNRFEQVIKFQSKFRDTEFELETNL